jgi:hypothetical protein
MIFCVRKDELLPRRIGQNSDDSGAKKQRQIDLSICSNRLSAPPGVCSRIGA